MVYMQLGVRRETGEGKFSVSSKHFAAFIVC